MCEDNRNLTLLRVFYYQSHLLQNNPFSRLPIPIFSSQSSVSFISKLSFIHFKTSFSRFKAPFQPVETLFFSFQPPVSSSPYLVFLISTPILLFLKLIFLISPPASFISNLNLSYLRLYFPITTVLNQSLRTPAYWSWESESRITT